MSVIETKCEKLKVDPNETRFINISVICKSYIALINDKEIQTFYLKEFTSISGGKNRRKRTNKHKQGKRARKSKKNRRQK